MAWTQHTATSNDTGGTPASTLAVNKPSGAGAGTAVVVALRSQGSMGTITPPSGFVQLDDLSGGTYAVFYKILTGSEGATFSFSFANSTHVVIGCCAATPATTPAVLNDYGQQDSPAGSTHAAPSQDAPNDAWMVGVWGATGAASVLTWTISDLTERVDRQTNTRPSVFMATGVQASAGATGDKTATSSLSTITPTCLLAVFSPAVAGHGLLLGQHRNRLVRVP